MLSIHHSFTGGPVKKAHHPHPRYLHRNEEGVLVDEVVIRQRAGEARRMADRERKNRVVKRKLKNQRINYLALDLIEYRTIRQGNWYDQHRDEDIEDRSFWCLEQMFIFKDIYATMKLRPMRPLEVEQMSAHPHFEDAMEICQKMGLHPLMKLQCHYNVYHVQ